MDSLLVAVVEIVPLVVVALCLVPRLNQLVVSNLVIIGDGRIVSLVMAWLFQTFPLSQMTSIIGGTEELYDH